MSLTPKSDAAYDKAKAANPDKLVAIRRGDFYEFYEADAELVAKTLSLTLSGRDRGNGRVSMCGIHYHSLERFLEPLLAAGHEAILLDESSN